MWSEVVRKESEGV